MSSVLLSVPRTLYVHTPRYKRRIRDMQHAFLPLEGVMTSLVEAGMPPAGHAIRPVVYLVVPTTASETVCSNPEEIML